MLEPDGEQGASDARNILSIKRQKRVLRSLMSMSMERFENLEYIRGCDYKQQI